MWQAKRDFDRIIRKATCTPYEDRCNIGTIHSISCCSGGEYCLVSDELRIYLWRLDAMDKHPTLVLDLGLIGGLVAESNVTVPNLASTSSRRTVSGWAVRSGDGIRPSV